MIFTCPECERPYETRKGLVAHRREAHAEEVVEVGASPDGEAGVIVMPPVGEEELSIVVDPESGAGGVPWNPARAKARAEEAAKSGQVLVEEFVVTEPTLPPSQPVVSPGSPPTFVTVAPPVPTPAFTPSPVGRRRWDQVKFRAKEGFPEVADVIWLTGVVEFADHLIHVVADAEFVARWEQRLSG